MRVQGEMHAAESHAAFGYQQRDSISKPFRIQNKIKYTHSAWNSPQYSPQTYHKRPPLLLSQGERWRQRTHSSPTSLSRYKLRSDSHAGLQILAHMHGDYQVQYTGTQGPTHWYTHQGNKYWWKGQGELYLPNQAGEGTAPQIKRGGLIRNTSSKCCNHLTKYFYFMTLSTVIGCGPDVPTLSTLWDPRWER